MSQAIRKYTTTITVTRGVGTKTVSGDEFRALTDAGGFIMQVLVKAPAVTDTFIFDITDSDGYNIFDAEGTKGKVNDITRVPVKDSSYVLQVHEAKDKDGTSRTGTFSVKLLLRETW